MTLNCDYLRLFCIIGAVSIAYHRPYHVGTVSSLIGLRYFDQWSSRGAVIYSGKSHYSHWFREYSRSEEVKEVSSQPIPFSTLQRYQISAVDVYSTLAEQISRGDESLEERVFREFTTGDTSPERKPHIEIWLNQARQFKEQGRFNEAIALNQRCIEEDPSNYRAIIGTATLLWKRRKVDECIRILQQGLQRVRNEPHLIQYLASVYMRIGRSSDALEILKLGIAEYPEHGASWLTLASLHLNKGDISSARSCLSTAVQNDPRAYACYVAWATLEYDSGDLAFAKELIAKALQIAPNSYRAWFVVTRILLSEGKYKEAQEFLLQCIEKAPTVGRLFTSLLEVYERQLQSIDPKLIEEVVQKIVQNSKAYGDGRSLVALIGFEQRQLRRLKLKINDFLIAAGLPPIRQREQTLGTLSSSTPSPPPISVLPTSGDPSAKEMMASLSPIYQPIESDAMIVDLGERINRGTYLYDLQQLVQNQSHVLSQSNQIASFGLFKKLQEQISRIRSYYQLSIQTNKYFTNTWIHWSDFEKTEGNYDVARKILIAGIEKFPNSRTIGKFHVALGDLAALTSDAETARSCYERALQVCPRHLSLPIYSKYYEMELMNDNGVKANKVLQQALTRFPSKREFLTQIRRKYIKDELSLR